MCDCSLLFKPATHKHIKRIWSCPLLRRLLSFAPLPPPRAVPCGCRPFLPRRGLAIRLSPFFFFFLFFSSAATITTTTTTTTTMVV